MTHDVNEDALQEHSFPAQADFKSAGEQAGVEEQEPMLFCPICSLRLEQRKCKLFCQQCGYYMSCADYY